MSDRQKLVQEICRVVHLLSQERLELLRQLLMMEAKGFKAEVEAKVAKFEKQLSEM